MSPCRLAVAYTLIMFAAIAQGATYHLAPDGADAPEGGTETAPWKTLTYAATQLGAGDVLIVKNGVYHERPITINDRSGTAASPITVRAAQGSAPVIDLGLLVDSWTAQGGGVYRAEIAFGGKDTPGQVEGVVVGDVPLKKATGGPAEGEFSIDGDQLLVYAAGGLDPSTVHTTVACGSKDADNRPGITMYRSSHWVFDGLTVQGGYLGIWDADWGAKSKGLTVRNCTIRYTMHFAIRMDNLDDVLIEKCDIYHNGLINWPRTGDRTWPHAIIGYDADNVTIENCLVHDNHGEGIGPFLSCSHWYMRNNTVYDNWSLNIYFDTQDGYSVAENNVCYNTGKYGDGSDSRNLPVHIGIHNENADLGWNWADADGGVVDSIVVVNNLCLGKGQSFRSFPYDGGPSTYRDIVVANNTFASENGGENTHWNVRVRKGDGFRVVNNIVSAGKVLLEDGAGDGIVFESNLVASGTVTTYGSGITKNGTITERAGFVDGTGYDPAGYALVAGSAALGAGLTVAEAATDFYGEGRDEPYDLGAIAGESVSTSAGEQVVARPIMDRGKHFGRWKAYTLDGRRARAEVPRRRFRQPVVIRRGTGGLRLPPRGE